MAQNMQVEVAYLNQLADEQNEAAAKIQSAKDEISGAGLLTSLAYSLVWDHGLISAPFWTPMFGTEEARETACNNMMSVCTDLEAKLRASADAYTSTDAQTGENLDQQMLPG